MKINMRRVETRLANFTIWALVIYVPAETYVSMPYGLLNPYYLVDVVAMALLFWGALHSRRARPHLAPGILAAGWAWTSANGWRATVDRTADLRNGPMPDYGTVEIGVVGAATAIAIACLILALFLMLRAANARAGITD